MTDPSDALTPAPMPMSPPAATPHVPVVMSPESLTPADALRVLRDGNARFAAARPYAHDVREALRTTAEGQAPFVAVLSCIDSRVPVETVFDLTIGHAFSARVAGNVVNDDLVGSLEFACGVAGSRLLVVLGHTGCGAVKGACDGVELGHLTGLLDKIQSAVSAVDTDGERSSANALWVDAVAQLNVEHSIDELLGRSDVLRDLVEAGTLGVIGAMYDVRTGRVSFFSGRGV